MKFKMQKKRWSNLSTMLKALYLINSGTTYCNSLVQEMRISTANYADFSMKNEMVWISQWSILKCAGFAQA